MADAKPKMKTEWKAPSHYKLVKEGIVADDGRFYRVSHGSLYEIDWKNPEYVKWAQDRAKKKAEAKATKIKRMTERAAKKAEKAAVKIAKKAKRDLAREVRLNKQRAKLAARKAEIEAKMKAVA